MKVNIVGAGLSGLYAGYLLKNEGFEVRVFEASGKPGGRIRTARDFAAFPIELGAEFVQGEYSLFFNYIDYLQVPFAAQRGRLYLYHKGRVRYLKKLIKEDKSFKKALHFFDEQWKYDGPERTMAEYLQEQAWYCTSRPLLDGLATEYGTDNEHLGIRSLAVSESKWTAGYKLFKVKKGLDTTLQEFTDCLGNDLVYQAPVATVFHKEARPKLALADGTVESADAVLVTVSLGVLQQKGIQFVPKLPPNKQEAIERIGFGNVIKVFLKFRQRFWKRKMFELYGGELCPLYYVPWPKQETESQVLVAYLTGKHAEAIRQQPESMAERLVHELDDLYGEQVASKNFESHVVMDWGNEQFIAGGYSYDAPHSENMRAELSKPVGSTLFFAGEATDFNGHNSTMQGAMQSAERAVNEILEMLHN